MPPKHLIKYFPELAHLPTNEQESQLLIAHQRLEKNRHALRVWLDNLLRAALLFCVCLLAIWYAPSVLKVSQQAAAISVMVVIIPAYLLLQQRRYIRNIRSELTSLTKHRT